MDVVTVTKIHLFGIPPLVCCLTTYGIIHWAVWIRMGNEGSKWCEDPANKIEFCSLGCGRVFRFSGVGRFVLKLLVVYDSNYMR